MTVKLKYINIGICFGTAAQLIGSDGRIMYESRLCPYGFTSAARSEVCEAADPDAARLDGTRCDRLPATQAAHCGPTYRQRVLYASRHVCEIVIDDVATRMVGSDDPDAHDALVYELSEQWCTIWRCDARGC